MAGKDLPEPEMSLEKLARLNAVNSEFTTFQLQKEKELVDSLVDMYTNDDFNNTKAWAVIGTIANLRDLRSRIRRDRTTASSIAAHNMSEGSGDS